MGLSTVSFIFFSTHFGVCWQSFTLITFTKNLSVNYFKVMNALSINLFLEVYFSLQFK